MQSMFLAWGGDRHEHHKLSEKAGLDKKRPLVEIPRDFLQSLKRKRSDADVVPHIAPSPKRQTPQVETSQQLPTPTSPYVNSSRLPARLDTSPQTLRTKSPQSPVKSSEAPGREESAHAKPNEHADHERTSSLVTSSSTTPADGYFAPRDKNHMAGQLEIDDVSGLTSLQQILEQEFNHQILLKNRELRFIEQELAKCKIALEQLRRCELRPYPGYNGMSLAVSEGSGPAVEPQPGFSRPSHPAPYGVADGPYERHYRQWLLQDPQFESMPQQTLAQAEYLANTAGRATRNNGQHHSRHASKSAKATARGSDAQLSIPNYPAPAPVKDKNAPLVLRRSTDNQLVKLICNNCKRGNFSSIQGFLNHCRIAHKVDYKSHDLAAIDCGQPLDPQELANLPPDTHATPAPKPAHAPSRSVSNPVHTAIPKLGSGHVHPYNTADGLALLNTPRPTAAASPTAVRPVQFPAPARNTLKNASTSSSFTPASQTPRLSAHFTKHSIPGDLQQAVVDAKEKVDLSQDEDMQTPETPDVESPAVPYQGGARMPISTAHLASAEEGERPVSRKGFRQPSQRPRPAPLAPTQPQDLHRHDSTLSSPDATMSPHTADSAPELVSDHEDDDQGSPSDDEEHSNIAVANRPRLPMGRSCGDDAMDVEVQTDDEMDEHSVIIRRNSMTAQEARAAGFRSAGSPSRKIGRK